jgi:PAS domain S-box-containing protein
MEFGKKALQELSFTDLQADQIVSSLFGGSGLLKDHALNYRDPYEVIVDHLPHLVFLKNVDSVYLNCNQQLADFLHIKPSDIVGRTDLDFFNEQQAMNNRHEDMLTLEQGIPRQYMQEYNKNDVKSFLQITKIPIQDKSGKNLGILGILFEISDAVTFYEILENNRLQKVLVAENNQDVFYKINFGGKDGFISENVVTLTGYTPEEELGRTYEDRVAPRSLPVLNNLTSFFHELKKRPVCIKDRSLYYQKADLELNRKDGKTVWVESINTLFFSSSGVPAGIIGMYRNINDRKLMEFRVQETLEKSRQIGRAQAQIISTLSHEFRTPLSILQSNLQMLEQYRNKLDDKYLDDIFDLSLEALKAMNHTLDNISFLAKNQKGAFILNPEELNLGQFLKKLIRELVCIPEYNHRIVSSIKLARTHYQLDPVLMKHIFINLLINGLNYSAPTQKVEIRVEDQGGQLRFHIKDHGIGIPEEDLNKIFESFFRAGNVNGVKGSGLGLAIVKECVSLHGGKIRISSQVNQGTDVEVLIPVADE